MNIKKIKFEKTEDDYWYGSIQIGPIFISLTAGKFNYSIPFETLKDPYSYERYEVIASNVLLKNAIVTHNYFSYMKGNIAPYVSVDDINKGLMRIGHMFDDDTFNNII